MSAGRIQIAIAADAPYVPWAATAMLSALDRHEHGELAFHLLHDGSVGDDDARRLTELVTSSGGDVRLLDVQDDRLVGAPPSDAGMVTWFRLLVPDLIAAQRVLLIDPDTFVAQPLRELWATSLDAGPVAAVANVVEPVKRLQVASIGIDDPHSYFNAGVVLMDLQAMRAEGAVSSMLAFAKDNASRIPWLDQDTLNVVFAGRWQALHPKWNAMNSLWMWRAWAEELFGADVVREATTSPGILHFEGPGPLKPWHALNEHSWRDAYRRTLARTPWAREPLESDDVVVRLIGRLPKSWRLPAYWRWARLRRA